MPADHGHGGGWSGDVRAGLDGACCFSEFWREAKDPTGRFSSFGGKKDPCVWGSVPPAKIKIMATTGHACESSSHQHSNANTFQLPTPTPPPWRRISVRCIQYYYATASPHHHSCASRLDVSFISAGLSSVEKVKRWIGRLPYLLTTTTLLLSGDRRWADNRR